jgi:hypothetical protein
MKALMFLPRRSSGRLHDRVTVIVVPTPRKGTRIIDGSGALDLSCADAGVRLADTALTPRTRKPMVTAFARIAPPYVR